MSATAEPYSIGILRSGATNISGDTEQAIRCKRTARDEFPSGDPQVTVFWRFPKKIPICHADSRQYFSEHTFRSEGGL
jgi:hypothetical protein